MRSRPMIVAASIISDKRTLCIAAFAVASRTPALHTGNFPTKTRPLSRSVESVGHCQKMGHSRAGALIA